MKKLIYAVLVLIFTAGITFATDTKISELPALGTPADLDVAAWVDMSGGVTSKLTYADLAESMQSTLAFIHVGRPVFAYASATTITIGGGGWRHSGTTDQVVYINSDITHTISGSATSDWQYIYVDDSAVVTADTDVLTGTEIINSTAEPTWSDAKKGWYNGSDLCIFAVYEDSSGNVRIFYHGGADLVQFFEDVTLNSGSPYTVTDPNWTTVALANEIPAFSIGAQLTFGVFYTGDSAQSYLRSATSGEGHFLGNVESSIGNVSRTLSVNFSSSQNVYLGTSSSDSIDILVYVNGFYLPAGM